CHDRSGAARGAASAGRVERSRPGGAAGSAHGQPVLSRTGALERGDLGHGGRGAPGGGPRALGAEAIATRGTRLTARPRTRPAAARSHPSWVALRGRAAVVTAQRAGSAAKKSTVCRTAGRRTPAAE